MWKAEKLHLPFMWFQAGRVCSKESERRRPSPSLPLLVCLTADLLASLYVCMWSSVGHMCLGIHGSLQQDAVYLTVYVYLGLARTVYIYTVYDCRFGDFPAKNTVYTPFIFMVLANPVYT